MTDFTQIGSLPFNNIEEALDYSFKHSIPFVPDLPALTSNEFMLEQASLSKEFAYRQVAMKDFLTRAVNFKGVIKNQLPGPLCISRFLTISRELALGIFERLLIDRLDIFSERECWLFIDEPTLATESQKDRELLMELVNKYKRPGLSLAIHYCGRESLDIKNWDLDISLSLDFSLQLDHLSELKKLNLIPGISAHELLHGDFKLITPPCGLWGSKSTAQTLNDLKNRSL